ETSAEALVSLKGIGSQSPFSSPVRRSTPPRTKKRTRQLDDSLEDTDQDTGTDEGEFSLSSPRTRFVMLCFSVICPSSCCLLTFIFYQSLVTSGFV
ncbi:unnamed protein product, partial [Porites evermanni]